MPRHLSGQQMITILDCKEKEKQEEESRKAKLKADREEKRKKREADKNREQQEKERMAQKREEEHRRKNGKQKAVKHSRRQRPIAFHQDVVDDGICGTCGTNDTGNWICCDNCSTWHHLTCVGLRSSKSLENDIWMCTNC